MAKLSLKEFFETEQRVGQTQDDSNYRQLHYDLGANIKRQFPNISSLVEIGPGPGALMEYLLKTSNIKVTGYDINPYSKEYFFDRNPVYEDNYQIISKLNEVEDNADMLVSIETFEHIVDEEINAFMETSADNYKYFWFSSTPFKTTPENDEAWGHINIKADHEWVNLFEKHGWMFYAWAKMPTRWSMLFRSGS